MRYQDQLFQQRENALLDSARQLFQNDSWDRVTIAEVEEIVELGALDPGAIITPGIYVRHLLRGEAYQKPIERRTLRGGPESQP